MKSMFKVSLLAATIALMAGCQEEAAAPAEAPAVEAAKTVEFKNDDEKVAYAIGVSFANYLGTSLDKPKEFGVDLSKELVLKGIEDAFAEKSSLTEEEIQTALQDFDTRVNELATAQVEEKAAAAKKAGDEFRAEYAKKDGVTQTESGILYQVLTEGTGASPEASDTVEVHYKGTLIDGTQFDSSYDRNESATFPLDRVIPGWTEGVQLMKEGSKFEFVIPPELAYGENDTGTIPPHSTLIFEVELLKVVKPEAQPTSAE
ncbi:FKBP-type peptidyl-prolyl cis-trans isomerase [Vibrio sp. RC27]